MRFYDLPWLEVTLLLPLVGVVLLRLVRRHEGAILWSSVVAGLTLLCSIAAWLAWHLSDDPAALHGWQAATLGRVVFRLDQLSAPLPALGALLHFLTVMSTSRTMMGRISPSWMLGSEAIRLATFSCVDPWTLTVLMILGVLPTLIDLFQRGERTRVYLIHMLLFSALLLFGTASVTSAEPSAAGIVALLVAVLVRAGTFPLHCWVTDLFQRGSFGQSMLLLTPLSGVYVAIRLVLPAAPDWALRSIGAASIVTAVYAACMASVQRDTRGFFAYFYLSQSALVLVGLELHTAISLTGALSLWLSASMAICGVGLTIRALEARHGRLHLREFHGLYEQSPALAVGFLLTGLACVGFPGTLGFVAAELLVDGAIETHVGTGLAVVLATAFNGIAVMRVYFLLFTGRRPASTLKLTIGRREQVAVLTLVALLIGGGLWPQPGIASRHEAAEAIIAQREALGKPHEPAPDPHGPRADAGNARHASN
jgi:NADH-quinone oxidoreductase subunit M